MYQKFFIFLFCVVLGNLGFQTDLKAQELRFVPVAGSPALGPINCLAIDGQGAKWAGSEQGLLFIDGEEKRIYTADNSALRDGHINCLLIDNQDNKWMGTYTKGLMRLDKQGRFYHYPFADAKILLITDIAIDALNQVWVSTSQGGIYLLEDEQLVRKYHPKDNKFPSSTVYAIGFLSSGEFWAGTDEGLCLIGENKLKTIRSLMGLRGLLEEDGLWIAGGLGDKGPVLWRNRGSTWEEVSDFCKPLPPLGKMMKGASYFWLVTDDGLLRFNGRSCKRFDQRYGLKYASLTSVAQDLDSTLWVGTAQGQVWHLAPILPEIADTVDTSIRKENLKLGEVYSLKATQFQQSADELLDSASAMQELQEIYQYWLQYPQLYVEIEGHTDNRGSQIENWKLSRARAQRVGSLLDDLGILSSKIRMAWHGESQPKVPNDSEEHRAINRRVEIRFSSE